MPHGAGGHGYRDELATAYKRIAELESENRALKAELGRRGQDAMHEHVRELDASLQRWDRVRATLAMLLGFTGLFALRIADRWSVRAALLASCAAMVVVGVTLAWPKVVRAPVDPKPWALDVSRRWRRRKARKGAGGSTATSDGATDVTRVRVAAGSAQGRSVRALVDDARDAGQQLGEARVEATRDRGGGSVEEP